MLTWQEHGKYIGMGVVLLFFCALYLLLLTVTEINAINAILAGVPQPTAGQFLADRRVRLAFGMFAVGGVGAVLSTLLFVGGTASDLAAFGLRGSYQRGLRREAIAELDDDDAPDLLVMLQMLELENDRDGWQMETLNAYLDLANKDSTPIDGQFLTGLTTYCKQAHGLAEDTMGGGEEEIEFAGRTWNVSELITKAEKVVDRIRDLRHRDSRPRY